MVLQYCYSWWWWGRYQNGVHYKIVNSQQFQNLSNKMLSDLVSGLVEDTFLY